MMMFLAVFGTVLAAYLIGSVNFAVIFSGAFMKKDVRQLGSGNAGATNVLRTAGFLPGILTFLCDALKGAAACYIGKTVFELLSKNHESVWLLPIVGAYLCGVACMIGHVFPAFFQFRGGKGVAVSVGIYAICCPIAIIIGLLVFALSVLVSKYVSLGSLVAAVTVVSLSLIFHRSGGFAVYALLSISMGVIIFIKHKENIVRLLRHEERKINIRRR